MASVTVYSKEHIDGILDLAVTGAAITGGHLILTLGDGSTIDVGTVVAAVPDASDSVKGIVELATDAETASGTDTARAVTPFGLASLVASATAKGLVELATTAETTTGTDTVRATTPAGVAAAVAAVAATLQPHDVDLDAIAGITGKVDGDFLQYVSASGAWDRRTKAQSAGILGTVGMPIVSYSTGSGYTVVNGPAIYVGPTDPGSVANGSIWLDTTGA